MQLSDFIQHQNGILPSLVQMMEKVDKLFFDITGIESELEWRENHDCPMDFPSLTVRQLKQLLRGKQTAVTASLIAYGEHLRNLIAGVVEYESTPVESVEAVTLQNT